ncbi:hypothetical protein ABZY19_29175 [Streptomyces sp. NPDC006475]|uniref:hypothetical protein n=1 Tax=Streptomyces sp. NPDC006475 TaxID=3155719 RepID=UPI0033A04416
MTSRRTLVPGPQAAQSIRASQADLVGPLPGVNLPDLEEMRARGVLGTREATPPTSRRSLCAGSLVDEEPPHPSA